MKIDVAIFYDAQTDEYLWADEADYGRSYQLKFPAGRTVSDTWLEANGLADSDEDSSADEIPELKQVPKPEDKNFKPQANK